MQISVFCIDLRTKSVYFLVHNQLTGFDKAETVYCAVRKEILFLAFAELRKAIIIFVMPICLSVCLPVHMLAWENSDLTRRILINYKNFIYSPTDAPVSCLKNGIKIYIKIFTFVPYILILSKLYLFTN